MAAWITGIIVSLILIWQFVVPLFNNDNGSVESKDATIQKQAIPETKKEPENARHVDVNDILRVREFSKNREEIIDIHFLSLSSESAVFAKELQTELSRYYKMVNLIDSNHTAFTSNPKFDILRGANDKIIIQIPQPTF